MTVKNKNASSHRVAYEVFKGPIPEGFLIRHVCDSPTCVNPEHLITGTVRDNTIDKLSRGRWKGNQKLTTAQVIAIKKLLHQKFLCRVIAEQFGVREVTIRAIKQGRNWRKIP